MSNGTCKKDLLALIVIHELRKKYLRRDLFVAIFKITVQKASAKKTWLSLLYQTKGTST